VFVNLGNVDSFLLEVWLTLNFSARVKLRRTSAVTVSSTDLGLFPSNVALLGHIGFLGGRILPWAHNIAILCEVPLSRWSQ